MTKKDYIKIANVLSQTLNPYEETFTKVIMEFIKMLQSDNELFDETRFVDYIWKHLPKKVSK